MDHVHDGHGTHDHDTSQAGRPPHELEPGHTGEDAHDEPLPDELRETVDRNPLAGRTYIYRAGELLVDAADSADAQRYITGRKIECWSPQAPDPKKRRPIDQQLVRTLDRIGLELIGVEVDDVGGHDSKLVELVSDLRTQKVEKDGRKVPLTVYPNHALSVASHVAWCPTGPPREPGKNAIPFEPAARPQQTQSQKDPAPSGPIIGLIDAGFTDHPFLDRRMRKTQADRETLRDRKGALSPYAGHGNFSGGVLVENAPDATVIARRLRPIEGSPTMIYVDDTMLARALLRAWDAFKAIDILVLPIAGPTHDRLGLPATRRVLDRYRGRNPNLVIVAAAGNDHTETPYYPAAYCDVVGVAALTLDEADRADFSNYGPWVKASAAGDGLYSTFVDWQGRLASVRPGTAGGSRPANEFTFSGSAIWSGTSFAAPAVAAVIANRLASEPGPVAVANLLWREGVKRIPGLGAVVHLPRGSRTLSG